MSSRLSPFALKVTGTGSSTPTTPRWLPALPDESFRLIYIDPPFNTGKVRQRTEISTVRSGDGDRVGFGGRRYRTVELGTTSYEDAFDDYLGFIGPRLEHARRLLTLDGTLYLHLDQREAHYCKVLLDQIFGRECFVNEIIWAYDYGGRSRRKWPAKHDTILVYAKDPDRYFFDQDAIERIPYMAPGLVSKAKAERGKLPTDVWWHTIVPTNGKEKMGYASQKPEGVLRRIVSASSQEGDRVLDFFARVGDDCGGRAEDGSAFRDGRQQRGGDLGDGSAFGSTGARVTLIVGCRPCRFKRRISPLQVDSFGCRSLGAI